MGDNTPAGREGPGAQPAESAIRDHGENEFGEETGSQGVTKAPREGDAGLVRFVNKDSDAQSTESGRGQSRQSSAPRRTEGGRKQDLGDATTGKDGQRRAMPYSSQHEMELLDQFDRQQVTEVSYTPDTLSKEGYLKLGQNGATLAAKNYEGVIEDRLKFLSERTQDNFRYAPHIAQRMMKGQFVSFQNEEERDTVVAAAEKHAQHLANKIARRKPGELIEKREFHFSPLSQESQEQMVDMLIRGKYPDPNVGTYKQDILNHVARSTIKNGTYLAGDGSKFLQKVRSLLPVQTQPRAQSKQARK